MHIAQEEHEVAAQIDHHGQRHRNQEGDVVAAPCVGEHNQRYGGNHQLADHQCHGHTVLVHTAQRLGQQTTLRRHQHAARGADNPGCNLSQHSQHQQGSNDADGPLHAGAKLANQHFKGLHHASGQIDLGMRNDRSHRQTADRAEHNGCRHQQDDGQRIVTPGVFHLVDVGGRSFRAHIAQDKGYKHHHRAQLGEVREEAGSVHLDLQCCTAGQVADSQQHQNGGRQQNTCEKAQFGNLGGVLGPPELGEGQQPQNHQPANGLEHGAGIEFRPLQNV